MKYTRIAYAEQNVRDTLRDIVHDAALNDLPSFNSCLHARPSYDLQKVRITIIVERVKAVRGKAPAPADEGVK